LVSKTAIHRFVREFRWKPLEAGLAERPGLLRVRDERGRNWLHLCCSVNPKPRGLPLRASLKTADVLLAAGLGLDREAFREGSWKATPLWFAIARGENLALARYLLKRGADPNHCLWAAAYHDDVPAIRLLVAAGAEVDPVTEDSTPFLHAVQTSRFRAARALLDLGADIDFRNSRGMTALHYMLKKNSDEAHFRMFVRYGARGDLPDASGRTAKQIMSRKRSPAFRKLAERLAVG